MRINEGLTPSYGYKNGQVSDQVLSRVQLFGGAVNGC